MSGWPTYPEKPEHKLADLMNNDLGVTVEPKLLRLFVLHNWRSVSLLAHAIHAGPNPCDTPDQPKTEEQPRDQK